MSFPRDAYPYTNFHELNLGYFIVHFREIFSQWADLYDQMLNWKNATTEELNQWKTDTEADLDQREAALKAELETWKAQTGQDIAGWEDATLAALTAWQTATQAVFEAIRVEAAGSASAAAASAGDAATAKTAAETAQAAAEAAAASVQASAAQITTNTEDIADLKTQIEAISDTETLEISGTLNALFRPSDHTITSASYGRIAYYNVANNQEINLSKTLGKNCTTGFTLTTPAVNVDVVSAVSHGASPLDITLTVPQNAIYLVVYYYNSNQDTLTPDEIKNSLIVYSVGGAKDTVARAEIESLNNTISEISELNDENSQFREDNATLKKSENLFDGILYDGYMPKNGEIIEGRGYKYTNKIDVHDLIGETIKVYNDSSQSNIRFVCIYDKDNNVKSVLGTNDNALTFTIPEGSYYAVLSFTALSVNTNYVLVTTGTGIVYLPYRNKWTVKGYDSVQGAIDINKPIALHADTLATGGRLTANAANGVKRHGTYYCYCKPGALTDDSYIIVGKDSSKGYAVGVSASKWAWFVNDVYQGGGNHGLTIKDYLLIIVDKVPGTGAVLTICTNGGTYTRTNTSWADNHGIPYVFNNSGVDIADVKMTWTSSAFRNRNWVFGDSYVTIASTRWPEYVYDWGFGNNLLINGYPGEQSAAGYKDFLACLEYGIPSVAAWCLGMNDADDGTINSSWMNHTQAFLEVCEMYDITPILATIPCCPVANHSYKNAWIRSSGHRYIDFANAVNVSQDSTTWYDGMLADDNIHPTAQGAIALASQVLADYPELMIK